ncbi:hypothetical protein [Actinoplanes sp. GCM10030250]|uniref:hypothetical protein n=1 Tax=Actinoplanes sp. GCM10030250 TaxID=3273376 RepID=UPI003610DC64
MTVLAHGVGSSADLPLPLDLVLQAGAATVVVSFLVTAFWWREPRLTASSPRSLRHGHWLRYPVLVFSLYLVGNAIAGPRENNPAAHALFVWLWVGLIPVSVAFGPVWRLVNPLRTIFVLLRLPSRGLRPLPPGLRPLPPGRSAGAWPAAVFLLGFVWFELVVPHHSDPVAVGLWILGYALSQLTLATVRGEEWFSRGDCFEVYSELAGRLSPLRWPTPLSGLVAPLPGDAPEPRAELRAEPRAVSLGELRAEPGTVAVAPPRRRIARLTAGLGAAAVLAVWWGSTVFDSASSSPWWTAFVERTGRPAVFGTAGLILLCALVLIAVRWTAGRLDVTASLIPIAVGYTLAHYLSLLLVEGPRGFLLLIQQWGLVPGAEWNLTPAPQVITGAQIALILIGHVIGVVVAHDRALAAEPSRSSLEVLADELPLVLFMIGCTWVGLFLLFVR